MTTPPPGFDSSKPKFDARLVRVAGELRHEVLPDSPAGLSRLSAWPVKRKGGRVRACLEATGAYGEAPATYLHDAGHAVGVVNPAQIKAYARRRLSRAKTDEADATPSRRPAPSGGRPAGVRRPAVVAIRHGPHVKDPSGRQRARGECPMQVSGEAMRKPVHLAYGALKLCKPFDSEWTQKAKND